MRYIDADALIAEIEKNIHTYFNEADGGYYLAEDALDSVKFAPTVDAVEVVRCRECKNATFYKCCNDPSHNAIICKYNLCPGDEEFFCSYGERRENEQA